MATYDNNNNSNDNYDINKNTYHVIGYIPDGVGENLEAEVTEVLGGNFKNTWVEQLPILIDILKKGSQELKFTKCHVRKGEFILKWYLERKQMLYYIVQIWQTRAEDEHSNTHLYWHSTKDGPLVTL